MDAEKDTLNILGTRPLCLFLLSMVWGIAGMDDPWRGSPFGYLIILFGDQRVKQVKSH